MSVPKHRGAHKEGETRTMRIPNITHPGVKERLEQDGMMTREGLLALLSDEEEEKVASALNKPKSEPDSDLKAAEEFSAADMFAESLAEIHGHTEGDAVTLIKDAMKEQGLSIVRLAELLPGWKRTNVSSILYRGKGNIGVANFFRVMDAMGYEIVVRKKGGASEEDERRLVYRDEEIANLHEKK